MYTSGSVKNIFVKVLYFVYIFFFNKNNFSLLRIRFKTSEDIRQKYESLHTRLVYFRLILPLALKALFLVCEGILVGMIDLYN